MWYDSYVQYVLNQIGPAKISILCSEYNIRAYNGRPVSYIHLLSVLNTMHNYTKQVYSVTIT